MFGVATSDDYKPVTWMGRFPLDVTTILVGIHVACAVIACLLMAGSGGGALSFLHFDSAEIWYRGQIWRLATYAFVHSPSALLWFAIEMYMLYAFGREVERFVGQRAYFVLYLVMLILPTIALTVWGVWNRVGLAGSPMLHFGVFVAFATIYPNVELFLRVAAKWVALALAGIYTLQLLAYHAWSDLAVLWITVGAAYVFIRGRGIGSEFLWWNNLSTRFHRKPKFQVVPRAAPRRVVEPENIDDSIDPILDKISKSGINSLTATERRALDRARNRLLNKSK